MRKPSGDNDVGILRGWNVFGHASGGITVPQLKYKLKTKRKPEWAVSLRLRLTSSVR